MARNLAGLKRSARSRSEDAMQRATAAILLMQSEETEINFRSVAARAKVSTAWLYATKFLRDKIVKMRHGSPSVAGETPYRRQSRMNVSWQLCDSVLSHWSIAIEN
jgi:hypothetical protein